MPEYRAGLPPLPRRMQRLPIERGYPLPWFVAQVDGRWDFRVIDRSKLQPAIDRNLCWVCGQRLGGFKAFPIGPMCAVNRVISEPPSHRDCAEWSIQACPFLNQREAQRRTTGLTAEAYASAGHGIMRQPGVVCLWVTKSYQVARVENGILFDLGNPIEVRWYREGRAATREEVWVSIESGYPALLDLAQQDGPLAVRDLEQHMARAMSLLPEV